MILFMKSHFIKLQEAIQKHKDKKIQGNDFIYSFMKEMANSTQFYTGILLVSYIYYLIYFRAKLCAVIILFDYY